MKQSLFVCLALASLTTLAQQPVPRGDGGPRGHVVRSATSYDGMKFEDDDRDVLRQASVPCAIALSNGTIRLYYVDASRIPETANVAESTDNGKTFRPLGLSIGGQTRRKALDPSVVALPNGQFRLYYYACDERPDAPGPHEIDSAISDDGVQFRREGTAFVREGLVDPDVFWSGRDWMMLVFSAAERATIAAVSTNGTSFRYLGPISPAGWGTTAPFQTAKGLRMFAFDQQRQQMFKSFLSSNGMNWSVEPGIRLKSPTDFEITDPFVVQLPNGTWKMFYKRSFARRGQDIRQPGANLPIGDR